MNEPNSQTEKPEENRRYSKEQYDILKRCSEKKDMTEWNEWRKKHPTEDILLEGAQLNNASLCPEYYREGVSFLIDNEPQFPNLKNAYLRGAYLQGATLNGVHLEGANLDGARLGGAKLVYARLNNANLSHAHLEESVLENACLKGTIIQRAYLQKADFRAAVVDGSTTIWKPEVNSCPIQSRDPALSSKPHQPYKPRRLYTDFEGVALDSIRIDPMTKQLLDYNVRRNNWQQWYRWNDWYEPDPQERSKCSHFLLKNTVCRFWQISDYGISTKRIIRTFFAVSMVFAILYYLSGTIEYYYCGISDNPGIVANLFVDENGPIEWCLVPIRSIYFSIVTMTTLGFGDMYANPHNYNWGWLGHIILSFQVILGYVLLGALITRFAVLFTAGGPAGKFADE